MAIKFLSDLQTYGTINVGEEISSWNHGPSGKLQVNTPNNTTGFKIDIGGGKAVYSFSGNSTSGYLTFFKMDDVASYIGQDSAFRDLRFQTNSADRMVIKGTGRVGIGTTTPTEPLEVNGVIKANSFKIGSSTSLFNYFNDLIITAPTSQDIILGGGPGSVQNDVKVDNGDLYVSGAYYDSSNSTGTSGQVLSSTVSGTDWVSLSEIQGVDGTGTANYITKWSDSDTVTDSIIYDDGTKVGIGTTSPYKTLDVQGEAVVSQNLWIGPVGGNDATNSLEIGRGRTGNGICFIDMTTDNTTYTDYGFRLIRYSGVNANTELIHRGTGDFRIKGQDASTMTFYTGNSARMRIGSTGNVGIGTTSPSAKLEVSGGVFVNYPDGSGASLKIGRSDNSNYWQVGHAGNDFRLFNTAGAGSDILLDIDNGGISQGSKVGIGTASPSKKLHIADSGDPKILIEDTSGDNQVAVIYKTTNYEWTAGLHGGEDAFKISNSDAFNTNDYFTVESSGNVGIGTTSPDAKLRVNYDENTGTAFKVTGGGSGNPIASFVRDIGASGTINIHASNAHPQISFGNTSTTFAAGAAGTQFRISHSSDINTNTLLAVGSGGNVGIGTTSPTARLHVADAGNPTILIEDTVDSNQVRTTYKNTDFTMVTGLHGTNKTYRIMAGSDFNTVTNRIANFDGNNLRVSIGNVTPARKLHVIGDNNIVARFDTTTANTGAFISFVNTTSTNDNQVKLGADPGDGNKLSLWSSNTKTMTLSNGNVGIGTDSPSDTLEVAAASQQLRLTDTDDSKYAQFSYSGGNLTIRNNSTTTSAKQITLQEAGNVGIGTISPVGKLSVYRTDTTYAANLYDARSRSSLYLKGSGNFDSELTFSSGSSNVQFIQAVNSAATSGRDIAINPFGGNVGIGTTSPAQKLEVAGTVKSSGLDVDGQANSSTNFLQYTRTDSTQPASISYDGTGGFDFNLNGGTVKFSDTNSGSVGIGTTSPGAKLDVDGAIVSRGGSYSVTNESVTNAAIVVPQDDKIYCETSGGYLRNLIHMDSSNNIRIGQTSTSLINDMYLSTGNSGIIRFETTGSESMRINSAGRVGVGTTSPQYQLHSYNEIGTQTLKLGYGVNYARITTDDASKPLDLQIGGSTKMSVNQNGRVGIGTTNPGYNLDVTGTARITNNMWLGSNIYHDNDGNSAYIGFPADDTWRVVTGGSERLRVSSNGNVGIGVTGPSYALDVDGTVDATSFRAGGISKYTTYNSTNTYENYGTTISNIASSPVGYLYHDLLAFNYNYTVTQEVSTDGTNFSSETLDKRLFSQKQDQSITVVSSSEYAVRWTIEGTAWNSAKFINLAFTYTNPHPETRVIIESSADGTTWTSRHDSTASGITGTKSCYVSSWSGNNYVRITISKTSSNTNLIKLSSIKMMTARAGDQGDGMELQYPYVWDEDRNIGLLLTKSDTPTSKLDILGATNTSNSSLLRVRTTNNPNALEKVVGFHVNTNTERGYIALNQYGVTYSTSSDYRLKENVTPLSDATERLKLLKPCRFNFIGGDPNYVVDGFLAHEAAEAVPESVSGEKDAIDENNEPVYQGIDQSKIVPLLTAALQEAIEKIEQLENRIQTLENN